MRGPIHSDPSHSEHNGEAFSILEGKTMKKEDSPVYVFNTHVEAEEAIQSLEQVRL